MRQSQGRWGWLLLTLHYTSESLHAFLFHICTEVFHISGWIFRKAFQKLIQLALQMDLEENTWGLARLKLFCQHLPWAFSGLQSGISALAREKGIILCWPWTNLPSYPHTYLQNYLLTLWRTTFIPAPAQWPQSHRSKAALGPRAVAAEQDFPCTFSSVIPKAARELDAGDVNIDRVTRVFSASLVSWHRLDRKGKRPALAERRGKGSTGWDGWSRAWTQGADEDESHASHPRGQRSFTAC